MWRRFREVVRGFFNYEAERFRISAEREYQRYVSESIYDRDGNRWGRHGEEVLE